MIIRPPRNGEKKVLKYNTLLVDGNSLYKRSFLGAKNEYNKNGDHIGGLYQFITVLRKLLDEVIYNKVYVFWDGKYSGKIRYDIYKEYKSNRGKDYENGTEPIDYDELIQKQQIMSYLEELFIRQIQDDVVESDDFIAYYTNNKKENEVITICTSDRDFCQLLGDDVKIYMLDLKKYVTIENYNEYFNHNIENSALVKIMCGDSSDNIKGVKGLGEDTLIKLFPELKKIKLSISDIINGAKKQQLERFNNKLKPLKVLDNIINSVTNGIQGEKLYEINDLLVNLKKPLITKDAIDNLNLLIDSDLDPNDRGIKNVYKLMKEDGMQEKVKTYIDEYLLPFKRLIEREKNNQIIN